MTQENKVQFNTAIQSLQLLTLVIGVIAVVVMLGRRDAQLSRNIEDISELRRISGDLIEASIGVQISNKYQDEQLAALLERVRRLEG